MTVLAFIVGMGVGGFAMYFYVKNKAKVEAKIAVVESKVP